MTTTLDVALGLVFVFLVLSLLASAVAEGLEHYFRYRADYLRRGIQKFLFDGDALLTQKFYAHPLIKSLETPISFLALKRGTGPSYIPSRQFALALLDIASGGGAPAAPAPPPASPAPPVDGAQADMRAGPTPPQPATRVAHLMAAVNANAQLGSIPQELASLIRVLVDDAGDDIGALKSNLQQSFDASMDRVAGWYKRHAQLVLLCVGAFVAIVVNADTFSILHTLSNDQAVRAAVVAAAERYAEENNAVAHQGAPPAQVEQAGQAAAAVAPAPPAAGGIAGGAPPAGGAASAPPNIKREIDQVVSQLTTLGLPVGWRYYDEAVDKKELALLGATIDDTSSEPRQRYLIEQRIMPRFLDGPLDESLSDASAHLGSHLLGWLFTALAISFGAPFWFDTLNKIMVIRSTVKPREKSQEEGSEDRKA